MRKFLIFALLIMSSLGARAQERPFELSSRYDDQRNAVIEVSYYQGGLYSLVLHFTELTNLKTPRFQRMEVRRNGTLLTIEPTDPEKATYFSYRYSYVPGVLNPRRVDTEFVYRLPFGTRSSREMRSMRNAYEMYFGEDANNVDFKAFQFIMHRADTVYAARKGVVVGVVDKHDPLLGMGTVAMNTENNSVSVMHADGTMAQYGVLEKGSITVMPGDTVWPDTPIALAGSLDGTEYQLRFMLWYRTDNLSGIKDLDEWEVTNHYLDPVFATSAGERTLATGISYVPVVSKELIVAEMSKSERKARGLR
ncbi:MAG: hypothetical protein LBV38_05135 [Alistipes sp.]|jgi:murein DD-endopeptidase MepM/ murein hydrolase activator NlpD|nr:hypothetical protein [Alistipes sp.]